MNCPICSQPLREIGKVFLCPETHGELVTGGFLVDIENTTVSDAAHAGADKNTEHSINCPHCGKLMTKVNYNGTGVMIDSCTSCPYRWLDAGEIIKIKDHIPDFKPEDLLLLVDFEEKQKDQLKVQSAASKEVNPKIPLFNTMRVTSSGDSRRTLGALSGMALYGVITGMIKSKFLRVVIPIMLLIIAAVYYLVYRYFK